MDIFIRAKRRGISVGTRVHKKYGKFSIEQVMNICEETKIAYDEYDRQGKSTESVINKISMLEENMFPVEKAKASCEEAKHSYKEFLKQDKTATLRNHYCTKIDAAIRSYSLAGHDRARVVR